MAKAANNAPIGKRNFCLRVFVCIRVRRDGRVLNGYLYVVLQWLLVCRLLVNYRCPTNSQGWFR